jgi:hypothetical protein
VTVEEPAALLLASIDSTPRGRGELLRRSGLEERLWIECIRHLRSAGLVTVHGKKRGTRYTVSRPSDPQPRPPQAMRSPAGCKLASSTMEQFHDIVGEVLSELGVSGATISISAPSSHEKPSLSPVRCTQPSPDRPKSGGGCPIVAAIASVDPLLASCSCEVCGRPMALWIGARGPFVKCLVKSCGAKSMVDDETVAASLDRLGATCCRCGEALVCHSGLARRGLTCEKGRHHESWNSLKSRLRSH